MLKYFHLLLLCCIQTSSGYIVYSSRACKRRYLGHNKVQQAPREALDTSETQWTYKSEVGISCYRGESESCCKLVENYDVGASAGLGKTCCGTCCMGYLGPLLFCCKLVVFLLSGHVAKNNIFMRIFSSGDPRVIAAGGQGSSSKWHVHWTLAHCHRTQRLQQNIHGTQTGYKQLL